MDIDKVKKKNNIRPSHKHYTNEQIAEIYLKNKCNKSVVAKVLGMTRQNLHHKIRHNEELREMLIGVEESLVDNAEEKLMYLINEEIHFPAIKYYLDSKGKSRGYGTSLEITGNSSRPIQLINSAMTLEQASEAYQDMLVTNAIEFQDTLSHKEEEEEEEG